MQNDVVYRLCITMAEWRQKRVDIMHWLHGIQPPSPEPPKESDRELTSSSDVPTTEQATLSSQIINPISHPHSDLADNTELLHSRSKRTPINEPLATVTLQSSLSSALPELPVPRKPPSPSFEALEQSRPKSRSPLPAATCESKLPSFSPFDSDQNQEEFNRMVNRPPKQIFRASTSPGLPRKQHSCPTVRKQSSPTPLQPTRPLIRSSLMQTLKVNEELLLSRRKSLSQDDISQIAQKQRRPSKERHLSDSELKQEEEFKGETASDTDSQSSTGACGHGSDLSDSDATPCEAGESLARLRRRMMERSVLSRGSVDVVETRLRERKLEMGQDEEDRLSSHLLSPTSPPPRLSRQSHVSRTPSPTTPLSPYHTPITPISVRSEMPHHKPARAGAESESGISKSRLKQFNSTQQFSFDTTNDEDFSKPSRRPKFLVNNPLIGKSLPKSPTHSRSHSDVSARSPVHSSGGQYTSLPEYKGSAYHTGTKSGTQRQYKSHLDLSSTKSAEGSVPLSISEQIQLRKTQAEGSEGRTGPGKKNLFRQDSGLGTLSTISQRF